MFPRAQGLRGCVRILHNSRTAPIHGARNVRLSLSSCTSTNEKQYSEASLHTSRLNNRRPQFRISSLQYGAQQSRSISWTGWWATNPSSPTESPAPVDGAAPIVDTESLRAIKASHATADTPDPVPISSAEHFKPEILENVEDKLLAPKDGLAEVDASQIVEYVGFMKQDCGLDFGWGSSTMMQWVFEHMHITAGLPWATTIFATAILARLIVLKPILDQQRMTARMREVAPVMNPLKEQYKDAMARGNKQEYMEIANQIRALNKETGASLRKMILPILLQVPLTFGGFRVLRNASELPVPSLESESFLWIDSLASNDPYILPLIVGAITFRAMRGAMKMQPDGPQTNMMNMLTFVLPAVSVIFCSFQHTAVQLWFLATSILAATQSELLSMQSVRNRFGLGPVPTKGPPQPPTDAFGYRLQEEVGGMRLRMRMHNDGTIIESTARDVTGQSQKNDAGVFNKLKSMVDVDGFQKKRQAAAERTQEHSRWKQDDAFELEARRQREREIKFQNESRRARAPYVEGEIKGTGMRTKTRQ